MKVVYGSHGPGTPSCQNSPPRVLRHLRTPNDGSRRSSETKDLRSCDDELVGSTLRWGLPYLVFRTTTSTPRLRRPNTSCTFTSEPTEMDLKFPTEPLRVLGPSLNGVPALPFSQGWSCHGLFVLWPSGVSQGRSFYRSSRYPRSSGVLGSWYLRGFTLKGLTLSTSVDWGRTLLTIHPTSVVSDPSPGTSGLGIGPSPVLCPSFF